MTGERSEEVSSFTIIKGALIDETYIAFQNWDFGQSKDANLAEFRDNNPIGAGSANWLRDVSFVLSRRLDPGGRDRPLVELAQSGYDRQAWSPLLLWHMTRDEFLVRDFFISFLFPLFSEGTYRVDGRDLIPYLMAVPNSEGWTESTTKRIASGLLGIATDFGLMRGRGAREFAPYHVPDGSFMYLLHAVAEDRPNAADIVTSPDWRMYLMHPDDVERELLRLHQYRKLNYEVAGSLAQLALPCDTAAEYARELIP